MEPTFGLLHFFRQRRRGSRKDASTSCTEEGHRSCPTGQMDCDVFHIHRWCWVTIAVRGSKGGVTRVFFAFLESSVFLFFLNENHQQKSPIIDQLINILGCNSKWCEVQLSLRVYSYRGFPDLQKTLTCFPGWRTSHCAQWRLEEFARFGDEGCFWILGV